MYNNIITQSITLMNNLATILPMKRTFPPAMSLLLTLIGVAYSGMITSMLMTSDPRWMEWHLSRLGEGGHLSSYVFNIALLIVGALLMLFGKSLAQGFARQYPESKYRLLEFTTGWMGLCLIGVAVFPFDQFHVVHNLFGYGFFFGAGALMFGLHIWIPQVSKRTYQLGLVAAVLTTTLMVLHHLIRLTPLLTVELLGELFLFAWLMSVAIEADQGAKSPWFHRVLSRGKI